jgi:hypothetical protein
MKERYIKKYGYRYEVSSPHGRKLYYLLLELCKQNGIMFGTDSVFKWIEEFPEDSLQPGLFD